MRAEGITAALSHLGRLDEFAGADTPIGRIDPRAKLVTTLAFVVTVASYARCEVSALLPLAVYPAVLMALGDVPPAPILRRIAAVSPFAVLVGLFNPLLDRAPAASVGPFLLTAGWLSFASIMVRFVLSVSAALLLVATTGFTAVSAALGWLRVPRLLVAQLLLLYRYLFVLSEEVARALRAHALRAPSRAIPQLGIAGSMLGQVLLRTVDRAQRIHASMLCRGFQGEVRFRHPLHARFVDWAFAVGWCAFFMLMRIVNVPLLIGVAFGGGP